VTDPAGPGSPTSPIGIDSLSMWALTAGLPEQVAEALESSRSVDSLPDGDEIDAIAVLGMGGSGIAGDILAAAASDGSRVPVVVVKSYELPAWVGPRSLVFAVSCSGNTEETLATTETALAVGASVVVVSSGGELTRLAAERGAPVIGVPASIPQPRAAIGAMAIPLLVVADRVGLVPGLIDQVDEVIAQLSRRRDQLVGPHSPAREIARRIGRTIPLVHGAQGLASVAASRWKTQVNENAKSPAMWSAQPELCHNEIAGWAQFGDVTRQVITAIELRTADEHPHVARRFDWVSEVLREVVADVIEVRAQGETALARFFDLVLIGDFVSLHLADRDGVDPGPVPILGEMKDYLRASAG
jgi:glucose/mannose-6-phosphate isomerase